ncbi:hypothetical protein GPL26_22635 [Enterocloster citroniae]|jgi:hypothetical protein|uniref:Oxaloacetate decarboxylase n=1 Tax=Enterocloster citroniae TaxID=358743 RepID=A0AA41K8K7_9FIRM|nr:hypothetical protein [Enterocloster citroniae]MBT9812412.1 hypothetical protein [Enterocloster citroniae]
MKLLNSVRKYGALPIASGLVSVGLAVPAFAAEATPATPADWASVISALTAQISVSTVMGALATFVSAGIMLVFTWWGVRKGIRSLMSAFRKGRMSI